MQSDAKTTREADAPSTLKRSALPVLEPFLGYAATQPSRAMSAGPVRPQLSPLPAGSSLINTTPIVGSEKKGADRSLSNISLLAVSRPSVPWPLSIYFDPAPAATTPLPGPPVLLKPAYASTGASPPNKLTDMAASLRGPFPPKELTEHQSMALLAYTAHFACLSRISQITASCDRHVRGDRSTAHASTGTAAWTEVGDNDSFIPDSVSPHRELNPFPGSSAAPASPSRPPLFPLSAGISLRNATPIAGNEKENADVSLNNTKQAAFSLQSESGDTSRFVPKTHLPYVPRYSSSVGRSNLLLPRQTAALSVAPNSSPRRPLESHKESSQGTLLPFQSKVDSAERPASIISSDRCLDWIAVTGFESCEHYIELIAIFRPFGELVEYERDYRVGALSFRYASPSEASQVFDVAQAASMASADSARHLALPERRGSPKKFSLRLSDGRDCTVYLGARLAPPNQTEVRESVPAPLMSASATEHSNCVRPTAAQLPACPVVLEQDVYTIPRSKGPSKFQSVGQFVATGSSSATQVSDGVRSITAVSVPPPEAAVADQAGPVSATQTSQGTQPSMLTNPAATETPQQRPRQRDSICDDVGWILRHFFFPHGESLADEHSQTPEDHSAGTASKVKND
jgi:hypothetical protein